VNRQPQIRTVSRRQALESPVVAMLRDCDIEEFYPPGRSFEQVVGEFFRIVLGAGALPELQLQLAQILRAHLPLEQHLHREFT
jgi:hypothetical protein